MDTHYQPLYKQAAMMQQRFHNYTQTNAHDPMAAALRTQIHGLTNDLATNKNPQRIEKRLTSIQNQLRRNERMAATPMSGQSPLMSGYQNKYMRNNFAQMRQSVLQHPSFGR